jgi:hypothetical protein
MTATPTKTAYGWGVRLYRTRPLDVVGETPAAEYVRDSLTLRETVSDWPLVAANESEAIDAGVRFATDWKGTPINGWEVVRMTYFTEREVVASGVVT